MQETQNIVRPTGPSAEPSEPDEEKIETATTPRASLLGLFRALTGDTRRLIREELQLAKTELSEKISSTGRNAAALAVGGAVAYAGLIVLLMGLGWLLAWAFQQAGLQPLFAAFLGLAVIGLIVVTTGALLLLKATKALSKSSLAPARTLHTLQELKGRPASSAPQGQGSRRSSKEMQARVEATEGRMGETLDELGRRLSPQRINAQVKHRIQTNPYRAGLIAMGAGLLSGLVLRRRFRHA